MQAANVMVIPIWIFSGILSNFFIPLAYMAGCGVQAYIIDFYPG
jgi:hypothetical protein